MIASSVVRLKSKYILYRSNKKEFQLAQKKAEVRLRAAQKESEERLQRAKEQSETRLMASITDRLSREESWITSL